MPVRDSRKYQHYSGNRHYSEYCHYWLSPAVPRDFTGTIAGNRHYSTGTIEGNILYVHTSGQSKNKQYKSPSQGLSSPSPLLSGPLGGRRCGGQGLTSILRARPPPPPATAPRLSLTTPPRLNPSLVAPSPPLYKSVSSSFFRRWGISIVSSRMVLKPVRD